MSGTIEGGKKAAKTNKNNGAKGGKATQQV